MSLLVVTHRNNRRQIHIGLTLEIVTPTGVVGDIVAVVVFSPKIIPVVAIHSLVDTKTPVGVGVFTQILALPLVPLLFAKYAAIRATQHPIAVGWEPLLMWLSHLLLLLRLNHG